MKIHLLILLAATLMPAATFGADYKSKVWSPDNGNGTYTNPVLYADYSDPDAVAVGDDYYLTASSFNCIPGLPILHSKDLVNWEIIGHALKEQEPRQLFDSPQHGKGVWAPAIRHHNGELYIYWGDPDHGVFMVKTSNPRGEWSKPVCVVEGKGMIDPCPLWDDDGRCWLVNGWAGSRSGSTRCFPFASCRPTARMPSERLASCSTEDRKTTLPKDRNYISATATTGLCVLRAVCSKAGSLPCAAATYSVLTRLAA